MLWERNNEKLQVKPSNLLLIAYIVYMYFTNFKNKYFEFFPKKNMVVRSTNH